MLFNTWQFIVLVFITMCLYYIPKFRRAQVIILVAASLFFYGFNSPALLILFLSSLLVNVFTSYWIVYGPENHRRLAATIGIIINLTILSVFKYGPLIGRTFFQSSSIGAFIINIPLPIGISFFTFEGISLLVDSFKSCSIEKYRSIVVASFTDHAKSISLFVSFFPHLISGPILKAHEFIPQIRLHKFSKINWEYCFKTIVTGYFLKMVIADNLNQHTFWMAYPYFQTLSTLTLVCLLFGYSIQIFADFAGYSLIAIGIAALFGYDLKQNFNFPYIATSFSDFWKRWHITLSTFLKEYLYIPLGGNRKGRIRTYFNLIITMVLGGFWHGAAWNYAVWGAAHGSALAIERLLNDIWKPAKTGFLGLWFGRIFVFLFVSLAWLLFKLKNFSDTISYFSAIGHNLNVATNSFMILFVAIYSLPVVIYHMLELFRNSRISFSYVWLNQFALAIMLFMIIVNAGFGNAFIYFQF